MAILDVDYIGGYESGVDAAFGIYALSQKVIIVELLKG